MESHRTSKDEREGWQEFFKNISYKPQWSFTYMYDIDFDKQKCLIEARVQDSRGSDRAITIHNTWYLNGYWEIPEDAKLAILMSFIQDLEIHESQEWFRYKDELCFDPHKEHD